MRGTDDGQLRVRLQEGSGIRLQRVARAAAEGAAGAGRAVAEGSPGAGRVLARGSPGPRQEVLLRLRAGRHRQQGDELRLADARRGRGRRPERADGPGARAQSPGGDEEDSHSPRRAALPAARLPDGAGGHRPPEGRPERRDRQGRHRRAAGGDFFQPLRGQELLARPEDRRRLPGPGPGPHAADEPAAAGRNPAAPESQPRHQPDGPRRGHGADGHRAGRDRPQRHAALSEHHGQRRGGRPGPRGRPHQRRPSPPPASRPAACASASAARSRR